MSSWKNKRQKTFLPWILSIFKSRVRGKENISPHFPQQPGDKDKSFYGLKFKFWDFFLLLALFYVTSQLSKNHLVFYVIHFGFFFSLLDIQCKTLNLIGGGS